MKYEEALEYLEIKINPLGSILGLDTMGELCRRIGNPEKELKIIHVAGTNGKGSVCALLAEALKTCGYRVGRYLSPSVLDYREKIQVNGTYIPKTKVAEYLGFLFETAEKMQEEGFSHPTAFEIETAMAFLYLRDKKCDFCIVEVGMGGREDATNVIPAPLLCILTSISADHLGIIGDTPEEIAYTKAGIIKDNCTVVTAPQKESILRVIEEECEFGKNVKLIKTDAGQLKVLINKLGKLPRKPVTKFSYRNYRNMEISLLGEYQPENAAVALEALDALGAMGIKLKEEKIREGFRNVKWPARFEILGKKPLVISDGAHNPDAVERLMKTMDFYFTNCPKIYIMGVLKDKAVSEIIDLSADRAAYIFTVTPPNNKRGMTAYDLATLIRDKNPNVTAADSVEEALEEAALLAAEEGVILAFGSLSYQGRLREAYVNYSKK